jgi:ribosomal protein S18 acetylase RimI-like enzyme
MMIINSTLSDIDEIFRLYKLAADFQRSKETVVVWPEFERGLVETEIAENRQWKLLIDGQIACVWATTFSDEQIWGEKNNETAVYIHRIATNPKFRGKNFVAIIVDWAKKYAIENQKQYVRLDTIGNNTKLIEVYTRAGFDFLGLFDLKNVSDLPIHYSQGPACLFQLKA